MEKKIYAKPTAENSRGANVGDDFGSPCKSGRYTGDKLAFMIHGVPIWPGHDNWRTADISGTYESVRRQILQRKHAVEKAGGQRNYCQEDYFGMSP